MSGDLALALAPYTSHSIGCAIYQRSWVSGEPPCTCGLDDVRSRLTTPSQGLDAATVERAARAMCVADGLDPDEHIIGGQATGFEDFGPLWQAEDRSEGQLGLTNYKRLATAALATEPHQHGGKGA